VKSETVDVKPTKEHPRADVKYIARGMIRKGLKQFCPQIQLIRCGWNKIVPPNCPISMLLKLPMP